MLVKPDIKDERIIHCLQDEYGLLVSQLTFLPLGADINTAVYRIGSPSGKDYFLKLRKNVFAEISVAVPQFLSQHGIRAIIPPLETRQGQAYTTLDDYAVVLYPFVEGKDGYEISLSNPQWQAFGAAIRTLHDTRLTPELASHIPREQFSAWGRESVTRFQELVDETSFTDETAAALAAFMRSKRGLISTIVSRTDQLAQALQPRSNEFVLCHADIHPGNLHIRTGAWKDDPGFFIVDWDNLIYAPKECDLTLIGGCSAWNNPDQIALFYSGYFGSRDPQRAGIDLTALTYYRFERIIQDIAAYCDQILSTDEGKEDREQGLIYFTHSFLPGQVVDLAINTDHLLQNEV